jgi:hypothetical protein
MATVTANLKCTKTGSDLIILDWDSGTMGEPTEENVLKELRNGLEYDVEDSDDTVASIDGVSIEEIED